KTTTPSASAARARSSSRGWTTRPARRSPTPSRSAASSDGRLRHAHRRAALIDELVGDLPEQLVARVGARPRDAGRVRVEAERAHFLTVELDLVLAAGRRARHVVRLAVARLDLHGLLGSTQRAPGRAPPATQNV